MNTNNIVFGKEWFEKYQSKLLFLLNNHFTKRWFRYVLRIRKYDCPITTAINGIAPNCFSYNGKWIDNERIEVTTDFRTHDKYAKRLYYAFKPLWYTLHFLDWLVLDRYNKFSKLSFDFATLTAYPEANGGATTGDAYVYRDGVSMTWSDTRDGAGNAVNQSNANILLQISMGSGANTFDHIIRGIITFDTSTLTSGASISTAVLSLYGSGKIDDGGVSPNLDIYTSTPASNNTFAVADYQKIGTTSQTGSPLSYGSFTTGAYNDFTFDATGRSNVSKTGISKFGVRNANYDVADSAPTWTSGAIERTMVRSADQSGTSEDPKLVVTYTVVVGPANLKSYNTNLSANIKTINTNPIANVKTLNTNA